MKTFALAAAISLFIQRGFSARVTRYNGDIVKGSYIIQYKVGATPHDPSVRRPGFNITESYSPDVFHGVAVTLDSEALAAVLADPNVESVEQDGIFTIAATQTNSPWGISRVRSVSALAGSAALTFPYGYDVNIGGNVDIYVLDTGIYVAHTDFEGRATWGATFGGYPSSDGNGHGTHAAGVAIGRKYGVAKYSKAIAVKVISDDGSGAVSGIIAGLNWVRAQYAITGRPSVITISLQGAASAAFDAAVNAVIAAGVHVVVAAGNGGVNAAQFSPARVAAAITVGASTVSDSVLVSSNFGSAIDLFAPGQLITSTWIGGPTAFSVLSGTSAATPHVAGAIAYILGFGSPTLSPAAISSYLGSTCLPNILTGVPAGTNNCLLHLATTPAPPVLPSGPL